MQIPLAFDRLIRDEIFVADSPRALPRAPCTAMGIVPVNGLPPFVSADPLIVSTLPATNESTANTVALIRGRNRMHRNSAARIV